MKVVTSVKSKIPAIKRPQIKPLAYGQVYYLNQLINKKMKTRMILTAVLFALFGMTTSSYAANHNWAKHHPRRAEVNHRLRTQNKRINTEVKQGEMSKKEAAKLKSNDMKIRQEERDMASQDKGHLTKLDQKALSQQLNKNSKKIGN
jgi:hypothetical protein